MRPPEFTGGKRPRLDHRRPAPLLASMRPPEFTGGKADVRLRGGRALDASMRPPEFTGGKPSWSWRSDPPAACFNEAAGIHRRKENFKVA